MNIEAIMAAFGPLVAGDPSAAAVDGKQPAVNFADVLAAQALAVGELPTAAATGSMGDLALLAGSPEAQLLRFEQLAGLLPNPLPAAATGLTLDLSQEASPSEVDTIALSTLTQMMSLLHIFNQPSATAPVEVQLQAADSAAELGSDSSEDDQSLLAVTSAEGLPLASGQISLIGLAALTGSQPQATAPQLAAPSPPLESNTALAKAVVDQPVLSGGNLGPEMARPEPTPTPAGNFEQQLAAGQLAPSAARGEAETQLASSRSGKVNAADVAAVRPKVDPGQVASFIDLRPTPTVSPANPMPHFVPIEAPADLPDIPALKQVIDTVQFLSQRGQTEVRLHLHPKDLGQLHVQLHLIDGQVVVRMVAESAQAQTLIQDHLVQLKTAFAAQGLLVDQLTVNIGGGAADANPFGQPAHGSFKQPEPASYSGLAGEAPEQTSPEPKKSRSWGLVQSVDYKI